MGFAACSQTANIKGIISDAPASEIVVKLLNVNQYQVIDTLKTDAAGKFSCKVEVAKGQPEFVYVFYKDRKVASLLLEAGDKVSVQTDTLGNSVVEGSEESVKLVSVEADYAKAKAAMADAAASGEQLSKTYVDYYRSRVAYVMQNSKSLTVVPVLYQSLTESLPVFAQTTDAIIFSNVADTLEMVYPESKYVKALRKEAERRFGYLELQSKLANAEEIGYPDIELPDINAQKVKLSEVDAKVIMVYFWSATDANQKMFNLDVLKSLYDDYHKRGFEIYQVALDPDKVSWAQVVKQQNLPWINVCDALGGNSPYVLTYNLVGLPSAFIISDGELVDGQVVDEKSLRKLIDKLLK